MLNHMVKHLSAVLDRTYGALSHPIRREMLQQLSAAPQRVSDLASPFDISLPGASKHVRVLESAGLIARTVHGRDHVLNLRPENLAPAADWIETYRAFWSGRLDALDAELRRRR